MYVGKPRPFIDRADNLDGALTAFKIQKSVNAKKTGLTTDHERRCVFTVLIDGAEKPSRQRTKRNKLKGKL